MQLAHPFSQVVAGLLMGPEMLDFSGQRGVVFVKDSPVDTPSQL